MSVCLNWNSKTTHTASTLLRCKFRLSRHLLVCSQPQPKSDPPDMAAAAKAARAEPGTAQTWAPGKPNSQVFASASPVWTKWQWQTTSDGQHKSWLCSTGFMHPPCPDLHHRRVSRNESVFTGHSNKSELHRQTHGAQSLLPQPRCKVSKFHLFHKNFAQIYENPDTRTIFKLLTCENCILTITQYFISQIIGYADSKGKRRPWFRSHNRALQDWDTWSQARTLLGGDLPFPPSQGRECSWHAARTTHLSP